MNLEFVQDEKDSYAKLSFSNDEYDKYVYISDELSSSGWDVCTTVVHQNYYYSLIKVSDYDEYLNIKEDYQDISKQ